MKKLKLNSWVIEEKKGSGLFAGTLSEGCILSLTDDLTRAMRFPSKAAALAFVNEPMVGLRETHVNIVQLTD